MTTTWVAVTTTSPRLLPFLIMISQLKPVKGDIEDDILFRKANISEFEYQKLLEQLKNCQATFDFPDCREEIGVSVGGLFGSLTGLCGLYKYIDWKKFWIRVTRRLCRDILNKIREEVELGPHPRESCLVREHRTQA